MTPRDRFAMRAMTAMITEPEWTRGSSPFMDRLHPSKPYGIPPEEVLAISAYKVADAMMKARGAG